MREPTTATCLICDDTWLVNPKRNNSHLYCQSCRRKNPERRIDYGHTKPCKPWLGDFDLEDNPLRNGQPHMPGERVCNHRDCVEESHIIMAKPAPTAEELTAERFSIYYRNKKRLSYDQLLLKLEKERKTA
jgi:hypothetical protein